MRAPPLQHPEDRKAGGAAGKAGAGGAQECGHTCARRVARRPAYRQAEAEIHQRAPGKALVPRVSALRSVPIGGAWWERIQVLPAAPQEAVDTDGPGAGGAQTGITEKRQERSTIALVFQCHSGLSATARQWGPKYHLVSGARQGQLSHDCLAPSPPSPPHVRILEERT